MDQAHECTNEKKIPELDYINLYNDTLGYSANIVSVKLYKLVVEYESRKVEEEEIDASHIEQDLVACLQDNSHTTAVVVLCILILCLEEGCFDDLVDDCLLLLVLLQLAGIQDCSCCYHVVGTCILEQTGDVAALCEYRGKVKGASGGQDDDDAFGFDSPSEVSSASLHEQHPSPDNQREMDFAQVRPDSTDARGPIPILMRLRYSTHHKFVNPFSGDVRVGRSLPVSNSCLQIWLPLSFLPEGVSQMSRHLGFQDKCAKLATFVQNKPNACNTWGSCGTIQGPGNVGKQCPYNQPEVY
ncbi:hypothetical protein BDK51DRAFT_40094 [Blyttiomyces helicus]|uniref:Uncharacterized protein n=1 Tax=Blyttiomyces helicus TaxID=388810 RepID=A0A4P9WF35_9FUNG|nr:hypothetical protein BDK51DRAFT_40094 [Blyttiomyces helicus]|eukprot:RKO89036.1 hypothetical protein BDK51DRAFT_40094 [Blyttiomyces helicus]